MVKICGITRREDAEASVQAGASALGFVFYPPSPRYVSPERAAELGIGLDVLKVGVFVNESPAHVAAVANTAKLDVVQLYGGESPEGLRVWRAFRVNEGVDLTAKADAILLDGPKNGTSFDWPALSKVYSEAGGTSRHIVIGSFQFSTLRPPPSAPPLILAGGLDSDNVAEAIRTAHPWGVDASSKLESAPGIKDHDKVRRFIEAAAKAV